MEVFAESRFVRMSPRKIRLVAEAIKKLPPQEAISYLSLMPKRAAKPIAKVLKSALANAANNAKISDGKLRIKEIIVNEGARLKRYREASRGRVRPYLKRSSHIRVVLEEKKEEKSVSLTRR